MRRRSILKRTACSPKNKKRKKKAPPWGWGWGVACGYTSGCFWKKGKARLKATPTPTSSGSPVRKAICAVSWRFFFPFFLRKTLAFYFFVCEPNPIYVFSLLLNISALPLYDVDKHKPVTNPKSTLSYPLWIVFKKREKKKGLFIGFCPQEKNPSMETVEALMVSALGVRSNLVTWSGHCLIRLWLWLTVL